MAVRFQLRRDTAANWTSANSVLALGEPGVETDTLKVKVGDGSTAWNSLAYSITKDFTDLTSTPTTLAGYGITDALALAGLSVTQNAASGSGAITYNNATGVFSYTPPNFEGLNGNFTGSVFADDSTIMVDGVAATLNLANNTTANLPENTNLYYTDARVDAYINASILTTDVSEGTNLYYTDARADARITAASIIDLSDADQAVATTDSPTFVNTTLTGYLAGPASFVIDPAAVGDDTGTVVIAGNLQVDGLQTTINSTTVSIDDLNFSIATDAADSAAANGAGITIGGAGATLNYAHATTSWEMNKPLNITGDLGVSGTVGAITLSGAIAMGTNKITGMGDPAADQDAATKAYVDTRLNGSSNREVYTATAGQTTFSVTYDVGYVDVYVNGVKLAPADFTASNGTSIILATGATVNDIVDIVAYHSFVLADHYTGTQSDARYVQVAGDTMTGDLLIQKAEPIINLRRSDNDLLPGLRWQGSGGAQAASIRMDGDSGTANSLVMSTYNGSSVAERLRILTGAADGIQVTGNVGIGTASPTAQLDIQSHMTASGVFTGSISTTTLTVTAVASGTIAVGDRITDASIEPNTVITALGTGTGNTGTYTVSISQTATSQTLRTTSHTKNLLLFKDTDTSMSGGTQIGTIEFEGSDSGNEGTKAFITAVTQSAQSPAMLAFGTAPSGVVNAQTRLVITNSGDVGIGTSGPAGKLHIMSGDAGTVTPSAQADDLVVEASTEGGITIMTPDDQSARIRFTSPSTEAGDVGGADIFYRQNINKMSMGTVVSGGKLAFKSGASVETMVLKAGNVGIGTDSPGASLHISKDGGNAEVEALRLSNGDVGFANNELNQAVALTFDLPSSEAGTASNRLAAKIVARKGGAGTNDWFTTGSSTNFNGQLDFYTRKDDVLTKQMIIDEDGLVGIITGTDTRATATKTHNLRIITSSAGGAAPLVVSNEDLTAGTGQAVKIQFGLSRNSGTVKLDAGEIKVGKGADWTSDDADIDANMAFSTYTNNALTEKFRIEPSGYLVAQSASQVRLVLGSTGNSNNNTSNWIRGNGTNLQYNTAGGFFSWEVLGAEKLKLGAAGDITGTMFNATSGEYIGDLDSLKKTGFYRSNNGNANNPTSQYYSIVVFGNQGNVTSQIAVELAATTTYVRSFNNSWTSWARLDT